MTQSSFIEEQQQIEKSGKLHWFHWLIVGGSLVLTLSAWYFTSSQVQQKTEDQFDRQSQQVIELISERMQKYEDALWGGVAAIYSHSYGIDHQEWRRYANALNLVEKYPGINGIGVIYQVYPEDLESYLARERQTRPNYRIHPEHNEKEYMPITYIEPESINAKAVGLDMAHELNRYTAAKKARDTGLAQITGPIVLVQDSEKTPGFLFYAPFYSQPGAKTVEARRKAFEGIVYAPFIFKKLLAGTLDQKNRSVGIKITDDNTVLYNEHLAEGFDFDQNPLFKRRETISKYGRDWTFDIWSSKSFRKQVQNSQPLMILVGGIGIDILLLTLFILLARANRNAVNYAQKMTKNYQIKAEGLEQANSELEEFAYRTSHDLRSPLTSSIGLVGVAIKSIGRDEKDKAITSLNFVDGSLKSLSKLIEDILDLTKLKSLKEEDQAVDVEVLIDSALNNFSHMEGFQDVSVEKDLKFKGQLFTQVLRLSSIVENFISNAIKYKDPEKEQSSIKISTYTEGDNFVLSVEDNGLGIPKEFQDKLFLMFKRFHPQASYGSGLGLYMVKKSAEVIGGALHFKDNGGGSTFTLTLPFKR